MTSLDTVFELLSNERRRYALYYLQEQNCPVAIDELTEKVADWESDPALPEHPEDQIKLELQHTHLPKATEVDFIEYKPDVGLVEVQGSPPKFDVVTTVARIIERPTED